MTNPLEQSSGQGAPGTLTGHELRLLLDLAVLQISVALREAEESAGPLSTALGTFTRRNSASPEAQAALEHLQFFDKLSQRLAHVRDALRISTEHLDAGTADHSTVWPQVVERIRASYSTADERALLDLHFKGLGRDVFQDVLQALQGSARSGELDLF